jgi:hypothetical protein
MRKWLPAIAAITKLLIALASVLNALTKLQQR